MVGWALKTYFFLPPWDPLRQNSDLRKACDNSVTSVCKARFRDRVVHARSPTVTRQKVKEVEVYIRMYPQPTPQIRTAADGHGEQIGGVKQRR